MLLAESAVVPLTAAQLSAERTEVDRLYGKYNPDKLQHVETLVAKYGEVKLMDMVRKKYHDQEEAGLLVLTVAKVATENAVLGVFSPADVPPAGGELSSATAVATDADHVASPAVGEGCDKAPVGAH